jgi:hypothetical protein
LKRHYVPSGTFLIGKTQLLALKALPGTCRVVLPTAGL